MTAFHIELKQLVSQQKVTISISLEPDGPAMNVIKRYDFGAQAVRQAHIFVNVNFGLDVGAEQAHQAAEWWRMAAETAETLDRIFLTRDDLMRRISVRMVSRTVTVVFEDGEK